MHFLSDNVWHVTNRTFPKYKLVTTCAIKMYFDDVIDSVYWKYKVQ